MKICINTSVYSMFSDKKKFCEKALLQATNEFLIFRTVVELKSFGFSCVVIGKKYSLNLILVSYFHFELFGIMVDIFPLVAISLLAFSICVFSLCIFCQPTLAVFKFAFSNKIILNLYRNFLIKMNVL